MEWAFISASVLYIAYVLVLDRAWRRMAGGYRDVPCLQPPAVSVVVVIHNEAENIRRLVRVLARQRGLPEHYEIIVVDDRSDDGSAGLVRSLQQEFDCLKLIQVDRQEHIPAPKKAGISRAVRMASGEVVLVTDGDCLPGREWVSSMAVVFRNAETQFVSGPVKFHRPGGLWQRWQALEFASLIGTGGAMIELGYPVMCNGANMGFRKQVFRDVGGYAESDALASGDDVFLMMKIHLRGGGVQFVKDRRAIVKTQAAHSWSSFFSQRMRWAGKWHRYPLWYARFLPVFLFAYNAIFLASLALLFAGYVGVLLFGAFGVLKIAVEYIFLHGIYRFQEKDRTPESWWFVVGSALIYPMYAVAFGILANVRGYEWKGRKYKR